MEGKSRAYRLGQFLRKHRALAISVLLLLLVAAWAAPIYLRWQSDREKAERSRAWLNQEVARRSAEKSALTQQCEQGKVALLQTVSKLTADNKLDEAKLAFAICRPLLTGQTATEVSQTLDAALDARNQRKEADDSAKAEKLAAKLAADEKSRRKREGVTIGMTEQEVLDSSWGAPEKRNKTTTKRGTDEQWVYGSNYLYFRDGKLRAIQH